MRIKKTSPDPSPSPGEPATYVSEQTHWWDASQLYGGTRDFAHRLRSRQQGKLRIDELGLPPADVDANIDLTGPAGNFWVGLALLHSLFLREHNAICDRLAAEYPRMDDQRLYDTARLITAAVIAKIHTIDWTPAIIAHPTTVFAMRANWFGLLGERFERRFGRITGNDVLQGTPGSPTDHHGVPYALTEEFVAVYRMHPLIPDDFVFRALGDDRQLAQFTLPDLLIDQVRQRLSETSMDDLFYSFGRAHPGALTLHNYPDCMRRLQRVDGLVDLAAADILRVRERGVPRYNEFRRLFRLPPAATFEDLTHDRTLAEELRGIHGLGVKLIGVDGPRCLPDDGTTQDLLFVTHREFPFADAKTYQRRGMPLSWLLARLPDWGLAAASDVFSVVEKVISPVGLHLPEAVQLFIRPNYHILGQTFFTSAALRFGDHVAKMCVTPLSPSVLALKDVLLAPTSGPDAYRNQVVEFLATQTAEFELRAQLCTDLATMPIEDAKVEWPESKSAYRPVAKLTFPVQNPATPERQAFGDDVLSFTPFRGLAAHRPLGSINRAICAANVAASSGLTSSNSSVSGVAGGSGLMYSRTSTKAPVAEEHPYIVRPRVSRRDQFSTACCPGTRGAGLTGP
jgi:Animal haem peroxidase